MDFTQFKIFGALKNKVKSQPIEWEKIFANYLSDISRIYKYSYNSPPPTTKKTNNTKQRDLKMELGLE